MMLKAGILGLGVGERHIDGYRAGGNCSVEVLCDTDPAKLAEVSARHPGIRCTRNPNDVLDDPGIDIVSIATWDNVHAEQIVRAIDNGKHVFAEKPLCLHEEELAAIRAALARQPQVRLSSNLVLRMCPRFLALRQRIAKGDLGQLYYLEADYNYGRMHKITEGWRGAIPYYSVFLGGAVHLVDLLLWMTGWRVASVTALGCKLATRTTAFRYNDLTVALLRFENGAVAKVAANFACVAPHFHRLLLYGTEATYENFPEHGRITTSREAAAQPELLEQPYPGLAKGDLLAAFVDTLAGAPDPLQRVVSQDEVFAAMSVCLAAEKSAREGATIPVHSFQERT